MSDKQPIPPIIQQLANDLGGTVEVGGPLSDGSGFAVMSLPLPANHWSVTMAADRKDHTKPYLAPPMPFRMGGNDPRRLEWAEKIREAGKYAYIAAGMGDVDHDPDAFLQNLVVGLLGYWSNDGLSEDAWANPSLVPPLMP